MMSHKWPEEREKQLIELAAEGWPAATIAAKMGTSLHMVYAKASRLRISLKMTRNTVGGMQSGKMKRKSARTGADLGEPEMLERETDPIKLFKLSHGMR